MRDVLVRDTPEPPREGVLALGVFKVGREGDCHSSQPPVFFPPSSEGPRNYLPPRRPQPPGRSEHNHFPESGGVSDKLSLWIVGLAVGRGRTTTACVAGAHGERGAGGRVGGLPSGMDRVNPGSQEPPGTDSRSYCRLTRRTGTVGFPPTANSTYLTVAEVVTNIKNKAL